MRCQGMIEGFEHAGGCGLPSFRYSCPAHLAQPQGAGVHSVDDCTRLACKVTAATAAAVDRNGGPERGMKSAYYTDFVSVTGP